VDAEFETLRSSAARVQELVLDGPRGTSSLATSLSSAVELIEDCVDAAATNRVCWGGGSALSTFLSCFSELETELELLGFGRNANLMEDQVDALWTMAHQDLESLASFNPLPVTRGSPNGVGEE
jgi:hypothetical protein